MPQVIHGSRAKAQSDPVLPVHQPTTTNGDALHDTATGRPGQQPHTQSDNVIPSTRSVSFSQIRLGAALLRGRSHEEKDNKEAKKTGQNDSSANGFGSPRPLAPLSTQGSNDGHRRGSIFPGLTAIDPAPRQSLAYELRPQEEAYYDSRAGTRKEWKRRAKTLEEYYEDNPDLLPQLPFSWHHGNRRWRLWFFAFVAFVDASAVPIALYYGMRYAGNVQNYIIFIVVTTIWGGPAYLEFAIRTLRLMKKENFYRPLGTTSRWSADVLTWASSLAIFVLTALFIIGSAPRETWLRVVAMAAPSILWTYGGVVVAVTLLHKYKKPAPFRFSSTPKGGEVLPCVYYFIEDTLAVNGGCGRPYREAIAARYRASPRFRELMLEMSWFWGIGALVMATILTVIAVIPPVPEDWSYGVCWTATFLWGVVWGIATIYIGKSRMVRERLEWETGRVPGKDVGTTSPVVSPVMSPVNSGVASPPV